MPVRARPVRSGRLSRPGRGFPRVSPHTAPAPEGRGRRPEAGWGGGCEEGSTSSAACGEGASPLPPQGSHARGTMLQSHDPPARQTGEVFMETRSTGRGHVLKVQRRATSWIVLRPQARRRIVLRKSAGRTPRGCAAPGNRSGGSGKVGCRRATQKREGCYPPCDRLFSPLVSPVRAGPARPVPEA